MDDEAFKKELAERQNPRIEPEHRYPSKRRLFGDWESRFAIDIEMKMAREKVLNYIKAYHELYGLPPEVVYLPKLVWQDTGCMMFYQIIGPSQPTDFHKSMVTGDYSSTAPTEYRIRVEVLP